MLCQDHPRARGLVLTLAMIGAALAAAGCRQAPAPAPAPAAEAASAAATSGPLVTISAGVEPAATAPGGTLTVMWRFRPAPDWHLYWSGRNDSGFAPRVKLGLPPGWSAGPLQWPVPARHVSAGDILDHVYHGELVLLQEITAPAEAAPGSRIDLLADWQWLACRDSCVPGRDSLRVAVAVAAASPAPAPAQAPSPALVAALARLPRPLPPDVVRTAWEGATLRIRREGPEAGTPAGRMTFMPAADCGDLADLLHDGVSDAAAGLALRLVPSGGQAGPVRGLLILEGAAGTARAFTIDVPAVPVAESTSQK